MNNLTFSEQKALVAQTYSAAGDARGAVGDLLNALENVDFFRFTGPPYATPLFL
jgi:hypothetical protein